MATFFRRQNGELPVGDFVRGVGGGRGAPQSLPCHYRVDPHSLLSIPPLLEHGAAADIDQDGADEEKRALMRIRGARLEDDTLV